MSNQSSITDQVRTAITNAHKNINSASQLSPQDEKQLFQMAGDLQAKLEEIRNAQESLSDFLAKHRREQPTYS